MVSSVRAIFCGTLALAGCATGRSGAPLGTVPIAPVANASFPISIDAARAELASLATRPRVTLARPLVVCGGFLDVGVGPWLMRRTLARYVDGPIVCESFATCLSLRDARSRLVRTVRATTTGDVDVIGQSLGGLIAVYATLDDATLGPRLNVRRLYTICSPLQGATLAQLTPFDLFDIQRDARPGSALGKRLAASTFAFDLVSYARTNDTTVGERYESLPGHAMWWVDTPADEDAHDGADFDPRILLDLVRRLRNEVPVTTSPPTALPGTREQARG